MFVSPRHKSNLSKVRSLIVVLWLLSQGLGAAAQDEQPRFYRFQYGKFSWKAFQQPKYHIYFPANAADSLFKFVAREMPVAMAKIKAATILELPKDLNVIIYPSETQYYESNIGSFEPLKLTLPTFTQRGNRVVLFYDGSYADLRRQLREGLSRSLWESQLKEGEKEESKGSTGSRKKTSKLNDIPFWYKEGAIRYNADGWPIDAEDNFKRSFENMHFEKWDQVVNYEPRLGGQAFCYFLNQSYYPKAVAQTFFQLKKKKSLSRAIRLITKHSLDSVMNQCFEFYVKRYSKKDEARSIAVERLKIPHKRGSVLQVLVSPKKDKILYSVFDNNVRIVYLYDLKEKKTVKMATYKLPPWIDDHSPDPYPLLQWNQDGSQVYLVKSRKGRINIDRYDLDGKRQDRSILYGVDGVVDFQVLPKGEYLLTAFRKGQCDIVKYNDFRDRFFSLTDDEYDDAKPLFAGPSNDLFFISNRPEKYQERKTYLIGVGYKKDTLWQGLYKIQKGEMTPVLVDTVNYMNWDKPVRTTENRLLLTSTKYGEERNVVLNIVNGNTIQLTKFTPFQFLGSENQMVFHTADKDSISLYFQPFEEWLNANKSNPTDTLSEWLIDHNKNKALQAKEDSILRKARDTTHYFMDDVFKSAEDSRKDKKTKKAPKTDAKNRVEQYVLQLHSAYFSAQVNNDYFINKYQPYLNYQGEFKFPEVGGMTKGGLTDLFENHIFTLAYRLPSATPGSDFFVKYENKERKIDWGLSYFRKVETLKPDPNRNWVDEFGRRYPDNAKVKTHYYEFFFRAPITFYSAFEFQTAVRYDNTIFLATDKYSLDFDPLISTWSINTLSYKINKLIPTLPQLYKGFSMRAGIDLFKGFSQQESFVYAANFSVVYHQPLYKYITLVTQLSGGHSGGDEKVLYIFGGENNNVTPRVDTSVHFSQSAPYAFQTLMTPFRGYYQNSLYGNQFVLGNVDIYFPLFQTLIPIETPLPSINNLQPGLLADFGAARQTWDSLDNKGKSLWSYGVSLRTSLAGYPLRLEVAWPGSFRKQPVWYFSLSL